MTKNWLTNFLNNSVHLIDHLISTKHKATVIKCHVNITSGFILEGLTPLYGESWIHPAKTSPELGSVTVEPTCANRKKTYLIKLVIINWNLFPKLKVMMTVTGDARLNWWDPRRQGDQLKTVCYVMLIPITWTEVISWEAYAIGINMKFLTVFKI